MKHSKELNLTDDEIRKIETLTGLKGEAAVEELILCLLEQFVVIDEPTFKYYLRRIKL